ncbi:MAG: NAD(P)H-dependent oxidoreductase [Clostridiales bacterium]|nr:NAD(P)H-dependent oxidoreductase [Clostridiales bacterium]
MKIVAINGTEHRGCTHHIKDRFLRTLRDGSVISEFWLPGDFPHFCRGCRTCFSEGEGLCPHAADVLPIWSAMREADLIVFAYPVYVSGAPGQLKALLDHLACHHTVHRPDPAMFEKRAVLLTQSSRSSNRPAQREVATSLAWLGVPDVRALGFRLKGAADWDALPESRRRKIDAKVEALAQRYRDGKPSRENLRQLMLFAVGKRMIRRGLKRDETPNADARHWRAHGWI